ncbi:hypothetical protein EST38_g9636 [Candolleomyces aberdarensis]|uniref:TauD/TfdA-like domain-containing protein n=1 Tax=Candolleomyces aberdarensis TaxID=2316362 RepID=A0A4V1Q2T6_9AGAR|nr:hypothetical protein EST38_g9636 [Candolleomyces aberdarensis]
MLRAVGLRLPRQIPSLRCPARTWTSVTTTKDALLVSALGNTAFPYVWLRDSCQSSPESIHPSTKQKLHRTSDVPLDIRPTEVTEGQTISPGDRTGKGVQVVPEGIEIAWNDGHKSLFSEEFLKVHSSPSNLHASHFSEYTSPTAWTSGTITYSPNLFVSYASLNEPKGLVDAMTQLLNKNIAYTNLDLGLHMDLLYFHHPPRFQALHCLRNRVIGGTSVFVDALHASQTLYHSSPSHFDILTRTPVAFQYVNDGHHLYKQHPTIQLEDPSATAAARSKNTNPSEPPAISHINYSPPFQGPLPVSTPLSFYPALKEFADILNDPKNTYSYTLKEGDCVLFDNRRVLHARTAFEEKEGSEREEGIPFGRGESKTNRWLKGCYLEADAVADRMRIGRTRGL